VSNAFIRKLSAFERLNDDDRAWLLSLTSRTDYVSADHDLIREGDKPDYVPLTLDGFARRYKLTPE